MKIKAYGSHNLLATRQEHFLVLAAAVIVVRGSRGRTRKRGFSGTPERAFPTLWVHAYEG